MPDLLFLTQRLPYPPDKGEKIRYLQILKYVSQWYDVYLGCLLDDPADAVHVDKVRAMCRDSFIAPLNRRLARLMCLRGLLTGDPLSVAFFHDRGLRRWVRNVVETIQPAVVLVISSNMAPYVLDLPKTGIRIADLVDVDSEKWRSYAETARGPMRLIYRREWWKMAELEGRIAHQCDLSSLVSDAEAALFARLVPECASRIRGVSNGVDHGYFDPALDHAQVYDPALPTFVFTGTMDYPPNVDAVVWFATGIMPAIRASVPQAQFYVVGSNPTADVRRLAELPQVFVTGRVADVRPYVAHATASVAPMRIARGIQNKVLEAMSMARPVVLTHDALEGIHAEPGREVILADTTAEIVAACCRLARAGDQDGVGAAARRRVLREYDWAVTLRGFDDLLRPPQVADLAAAI